MFRTIRLFQVFYDEPDGSAGGGAPAGAPAGTATPPLTPGAGAPPPAGAAGGGAAPPAGAAGAGDPNRPVFSYAEDRSKWIPPHRYNETAERVRLLEQGLANYQQRVRALMGVAEPENPRVAELKRSMKEMFPGLAPLIDDPEAFHRLSRGEVPGASERTGFESAYWARHGREMTTQAIDQYAKAAGVKTEDLGDRRVQMIAREMAAFIATDPSGQLQQRYEQGDPAFISEFIADLTGFYVTPLRKQTVVNGAQQVDRNRQLPSQRGPSGAPPPTGTGEKPKGKALHEAARQALLGMTNA